MMDSTPGLTSFRSTRPQGARRLVGGSFVQRDFVAIHAPTGGATRDLIANFEGYKFRSTRPQGARPGLTPSSPRMTCFDPRAHRGRDEIAESLLEARHGVSIHAPTGGATTRGRRRGLPCRVSIHAPTGGATWFMYSMTGRICGFDPRAHSGRDVEHLGYREAFSRFDPRARRGRDASSRSPRSATAVSIHAPAGGATCTASFWLRSASVSIHAPAGGATRSETPVSGR